jgi:hypothetical protein
LQSLAHDSPRDPRGRVVRTGETQEVVMQNIVRSARWFIFLALLPLAAPGCVAAPADADPSTATVGSELGEAGCETAVKSADGTWGFESVSAGNMYDPAGCPDQYLVGWGSLPAGQGAFADVFWEGAQPTQIECPDSHLSIGCYSENLGSWTVTSTQVFDGFWSGGSCEFLHSSGPFTCPLNGDQKNRTAAKAWIRTCSGGTCTQIKRRVGIRAWQN